MFFQIFSQQGYYLRIFIFYLIFSTSTASNVRTITYAREHGLLVIASSFSLKAFQPRSVDIGQPIEDGSVNHLKDKAYGGKTTKSKRKFGPG